MLDFARLLRSFVMTILALLLAALLTTAASATPSQQGQSAGIAISPPLKQLTLGPGLLQAQTHVGIKNNTNHAVKATIKLVDFKSLNESGGLTLGQVGVPLWKYGLANWMSLAGNNSSLTLLPGQSTEVEVDIQNRSDLTPGGHYGAVLVAVNGSGNTAGSNIVSFNQNLVSLLFVKKLGGEQYGLQLQSLTADGKYNLPKYSQLRFASTGNVYVVPRGYIEVTDPRGKLVEKGIINQSSALIMQQSSQQLTTILQPVESSDLSGKYKLTAYYRYEGQEGYNRQSIYFTRRAWSPMMYIITGLALLIFGSSIYFIRSKYRLKK